MPMPLAVGTGTGGISSLEGTERLSGCFTTPKKYLGLSLVVHSLFLTQTLAGHLLDFHKGNT